MRTAPKVIILSVVLTVLWISPGVARSVLVPESGTDAASFGLVPSQKNTVPAQPLEADTKENGAGDEQGGFFSKLANKIMPSRKDGGAQTSSEPSVSIKATILKLRALKEAERAFNKAKDDRAPRIINEKEDDYLPTDAPNHLAIGVVSDYRFGTEDQARIKANLGYTPEQIQANCILRMVIELTTDETRGARDGRKHIVRVVAGKRGTLDYAGNPIKIVAEAMALCVPPATLPQSGGVLRRVGNGLGLFLGDSGHCSLPKEASAALLVQYEGDSVVKCAYVN